ncbi:MAG: hypothetical protein R3337_03335 [Gammaproteobacteria bacterium]|nr:hypothetical protein [Gammaproteobacteria bacterium]
MSAKRIGPSLRFALALILMLLGSSPFAQEMTERHIPVGAYPYLKSEYLSAGTIKSVDSEARTLTLDVDGSERSFSLTDSTKIWLDRSHFGRATVDGELSELAAGLKAEVRSFGPSRPNLAYWIKVQVAAP